MCQLKSTSINKISQIVITMTTLAITSSIITKLFNFLLYIGPTFLLQLVFWHGPPTTVLNCLMPSIVQNSTPKKKKISSLLLFSKATDFLSLCCYNVYFFVVSELLDLRCFLVNINHCRVCSWGQIRGTFQYLRSCFHVCILTQQLE